MVIQKIFVLIAFLLPCFFFQHAGAAEEIPRYDLTVSFDTEKNLLKGSASITFPVYTKTGISRGDLRIVAARVNGKAVEFQEKDGVFEFEGQGTLEIGFEAVFTGEDGPDFMHIMPRNTVSSAGIMLGDCWYPEIGSLALYRVTATVPDGFLALSPAEEVAVLRKGSETRYSFNFPYPAQQIVLIAGRYEERREVWKGINIHTYSLRRDTGFAQSYAGSAKRYLDDYRKLFGPYPYKRLSLVEGLQQAGCAAPTLAVLGKEKLPFSSSTDSSFRRIILQQWFGNSVYADARQGNWADGLTAYLADLRTEEQKGKGREVRKQILIDYESATGPGSESSLKDYQGAGDFASGATGYGKGSMVFSMLERLIGKEAFLLALQTVAGERKFQQLSWDTLRAVFEQISGDDLSWFFTQWIAGKGLPSIEVSELRVILKKGQPTVLFDIRQQGEPYRLSLPVRIATEAGIKNEVVTLRKELERFEIPVRGSPTEITFDAEYEVMRRMTPEEFPPVIAGLLGSEKKFLVISGDERQRFEESADVMAKAGFILREDQDIRDEDIRTSSLLVLGHDSPVIRRLFGYLQKPKSGQILAVLKNPLNPSEVVAVASGDMGDDFSGFVRDLARFREYSVVSFEKESMQGRATESLENGITYTLEEPVLVLRPEKAERLDDILPSLLQIPLIYLGERHTSYEDHKVQLKVIRYLHEKGRKFAVGMEMFQQLFQQAIDGYLDGSLNEREFLRATGYYKRWQYDYHNYREIVDYAKANRIPIIALNIRSEIVRKVAATGMDSLTEQERNEIPVSMDMSDREYRARLEQVFENHRHGEMRSFENFYQSQILWDEAMAHAVDGFMRENAGYQMVVLAGAGHVLYGSGIPQRTYRLNGKQYRVLVPDGEGIDRDAGDFVVFAEHREPPLALKLGIVASKTETGLRIDQVVPRSIAAAAGVEEGDILIALDDWKIAEIEDVKIFMSGKQRGDTITLTLLRKRFLSGYKPLELTVSI